MEKAPVTIGFFFIILLFFVLPRYVHPAEDATILFRYSENLAENGAIQYNPGGENAEGATDFLWMVLISIGYQLGLTSFIATNLLSFIGLTASCSILLLIARRWQKPQLIFVAYWGLILNSQNMAAVQGFSLTFFGVFLLWAVYAFIGKKEYYLVLSLFLLCLTRPDGLVIALPLLVSYYSLHPDRRGKVWSLGILYFALPGLIYFCWRWYYFGQAFPLPFYVKAGASISSFIYEIKYLGKYLWPLLIGGLYRWGQSKYKPKLFQYSCAYILHLFTSLCLVPLGFYAFTSLEQNIADRFMYPVHLGILLCFVLSWVPKKQERFPRKLANLYKIAGGAYLLLSLLYLSIFLKGTLESANDADIYLAREFAKLPPQRLATTEAGRIPFYTRWESKDLWGLNSPEYARELPQAEDLSRFVPTICIWDVEQPVEELNKQLYTPYAGNKTWDNMVGNSLKYTWETGAYEYWWVPKHIDRHIPSGMRRYVYWIQTLIDWKVQFFPSRLVTAYRQYDLYAIHKDMVGKGELYEILQEVGARQFEWKAKDKL